MSLSLMATLPAAAGVPAPSAAEDESPEPTGEEGLLVYSVNRRPEPAFGTSRAVQVITAEDIWRRNARTLPEVLFEEAGIFVQQTNYGGGSPIIRGLVGKQVLILVDGIKLNNATYRFGPLQYLNTIDLHMVERIEIVRGVGSVLGSDALGGTINIITKKGPPLGQARPFGGRLFGRYSTGDSAVGPRAEVFGQTEKLRYLVGLSHRDSGDVEAGGAVGQQPAAGYDEQAGNVSLEYSLSSDQILSLAYQALEQDRVPRADRILDGSNLRFDFAPQRLQLAQLTLEDSKSRSWADSIRLSAYWNRQDEGRQEIRVNRPTIEQRFFDRQTVLGANLELASFLADRHALVYGVDYSTEDISSSREDLNLASGAAVSRRGNFTDGASYDTLAAYLQDRFRLGTRWTATAGARYSRFESAGNERSSVGTLDLDTSNGDFSGSLSLIFHARPTVNVIGGVRRGFRAPNIDDLSRFDERTEGTEVPNPALDSEHIMTYELGLKHASRMLSASLFLHRSELTNLIERSSGTFNGLPFFDLNGNGARDATEPAVLQRQNVGEATVDGLELEFRYRPAAEWTVFGNYTWTEGDDVRLDVPLSRIPPEFGLLGTRWSRASRLAPWAEIVYLFAAAQRRLAPADIADSRIGPAGTDGFEVVNLRGGLALGDRLRLNLGLENLTDATYKYHSSGVFRPGRQAVFGAEVRF